MVDIKRNSFKLVLKDIEIDVSDGIDLGITIGDSTASVVASVSSRGRQVLLDSAVGVAMPAAPGSECR